MTLRWENPEMLPLLKDKPDAIAWKPGDTCQAWQDSKSHGLIVAVINEEQMLVLWSRDPLRWLT